MNTIEISARETGTHTRLMEKSVMEVMSAPPVIVSDLDVLDDALVKMAKFRVHHLVVVDDTKRCVGVLSNRTIATIWATDFDALAVRSVASALGPEHATVTILDEAVDAANLMRENGTDAVAVTDTEGRPVGIVTSGDLVDLLAG